ncbi:hypothetical protein GQ42DRAFT_115743, partial [Ramicandelaber brevisporus]
AMQAVFGLALEKAVELTRVRDGYDLPAVVYRCIEYLDSSGAVYERGLYRVSGSTSALDVHIVASALKAYLRTLPENILMPGLAPMFNRAI